MSIAIAVAGIVVFAAVWLRRFLNDLEQERRFRAQLRGVPFEINLS